MISLLNDWSAQWAPWFLAAVIQNTIFLALVFGALYLLREASARIRTLIATVGVIKLVLPPLVPSHWLMGPATEGPTTAVATLLFPFAEDGAAETARGAGWTGGLELLTVLMLVWAIVAVSRLGWSVMQTVDLALAVRGSVPVPAAEVPTEIRDHGLEVRLCERIDIPLTMGVFARRIFVPTAWRRWSPTERRAVLRHELAHIQHRDGLVQTLEILAQSLFFFHPLVLILVRRLRTWREMACDDVSVAGDHSARLAYSRFLVDLAETALGPRPATESASTLARRKCELMKRVTYQVREGAMTKVSKTKLSMILAVLVLAIGPLSLVYGEAPPAPAAAPQPAEAPAPAAEPTSVVEVAAPAAQPAQPDKPTKEEELKKKQALKAKGQHDVPPPPKEALNLKVTPKGVLVAGQMVDDDHLKKILQTVATKKKDSAIIAIDSKGDVSMGDIHDLQRMLRDQDLTRVKYVGELGKAIAMNIPPAKMNKKLAEMPQDLVMRVKVDGQGVLMVDGKKTKGAKLSKVVSQALDTTPQLVVALATDRDTKYGAFVQVLDSLKQGGATRIAIQDPEG